MNFIFLCVIGIW